jgi:hypothetical protein
MEAPVKTGTAFFLTAGICACLAPARAESAGRHVTVQIRTDDGRSLPFYAAGGPGSRVYAEAARGEHYRIVVSNHQNRRVGLVIAVDGRNIISGQQSWLRPDERMYILGPYETQEYTGWRTAADRIHRFYFTEAGDSYAAAFGDESAMGLISVAAYAEARPLLPPRPWFFKRQQERDGMGSGSRAPEAEAAPGPAGDAPMQEKQRADRAESRAGTGYGYEDHSPSYTVAFKPERAPLEKVLIKYEWREALVRLGVLRPHRQPPRTRLWDDGYAPPPPRRW